MNPDMMAQLAFSIGWIAGMAGGILLTSLVVIMRNRNKQEPL